MQARGSVAVGDDRRYGGGFFKRRERQRDRKAGALAKFAIYVDAAAMLLDEGLGDREAKAGAALAA